MRAAVVLQVLVMLIVMSSIVGCSGGVKTTGEQSIYAAAEKGDAGAVREMLKNGFKINTPDAQGMTVLHHAAAGDQGDLVELLTERYGASPVLKDKEGRTPLDLAKERGSAKAASILQQAGDR